mmetsp:Transcript_12831/g.38538  ORF Transcript_12831/g.38538 Transcript_12831/m.38538 type:complete len:469 (+) Transcript_12831:32-1438(+)
MAAAVKGKGGKPRLTVAFIGQQGGGKSTLAGHLVADCDGVDKKMIATHQSEAELMGHPTSQYAWVTDTTPHEREMGRSVLCGVSRADTEGFELQVVDTPGHPDHTSTAVTGMAAADAAVLVVSAAPGEFEAGVVEPSGMTQQHAVLVHTLGVKRITVAVTKMDATEPPFSQKRFDEVKRGVAEALKASGINPKTVPILPVSGLKGDNLGVACGRMTWFEGWAAEPKGQEPISGNSLLSALGAVAPVARADSGPLRLAVQRVHDVPGVGTVVTGRVDSGRLKVGEQLVLCPGGATTEAKSVERFHVAAKSAVAGDLVAVAVGLPASEVKSGMVLGHPEADPPRECDSFTAQVVVRAHPGAIRPGTTATLHCGTAHLPVEFAVLQARLDRKGKQVEAHPASLKSGESGLVTLVPLAPACIEEYAAVPSLGRFALRAHGAVVAVGVVKAVTRLDKTQKLPKIAAALAALAV